MIGCWRAHCPEAGATVKYRMGRKLVGDRTDKARFEEVVITESKFADDAALFVVTRQAVERVAGSFVAIAAGWDLTVSFEKTKMMSMRSPENNLPIQLDAGVMVAVDDFTYLESNITNDEVANEVGVRLGKAARAFGYLRSSIFDNQTLSVHIRRDVYRAVILSTLLYGSETWVVKSDS